MDVKFESRKKDHIEQSMNPYNQAGVSPSAEIKLFHKALPEINFSEVSLETKIFNDLELSSPIFISAMTAGHAQGEKINSILFEASHEKNWLVAVGSQRKELFKPNEQSEWTELKHKFPGLKTLGNIGIAQLIETPLPQILKLMESLEPKGFVVHVNALQEVLQSEGTTGFKGGLKAIEELCAKSWVPIIVKETGCGFSAQTLMALSQIENLYAIDVAGYGGTHWGRIEGNRTQDEILQKASETYANWGHTTAESLSYFMQNLDKMNEKKCWASGGIRSGLDVVTCLTMGAEMVGIAQPFMQAALEGVEKVIQLMSVLEFETKIGLFCTGHTNPNVCQKNGVWEWRK